MHLIFTCGIPRDRGIELAKNGRLDQTIQSIMEDLKPEAAYFVDVEGAIAERALLPDSLARAPVS